MRPAKYGLILNAIVTNIMPEIDVYPQILVGHTGFDSVLLNCKNIFYAIVFCCLFVQYMNNLDSHLIYSV